MGNHKTIRAAQGCSGRAGGQNPGSNCAFHPGAPGSSRTGRRGTRTRTATTEDRAGDRGEGGGRGWRSPCCPPRRGGGLRRRRPRLGHRIPSRPAQPTQSSPRLNGKESRSGAVLRYPHTLTALTGAVARGRPPPPPPPPPIQKSGRSLREPC